MDRWVLLELLLKILNWLSKNFGPFEAALLLVLGLFLWGLYWHILKRLFDTLGEWCESKLRKRLSLPSKNPPHR